MPLAYKLYKENGERDYGAEKRLNEIASEVDKIDKQKVALAKWQNMLGDVEYVPPDDRIAQEKYKEAQRRAAGMAMDVLNQMRDIMFNSPRPQVRLEAAKCLWEMASRVMGGDGKSGTKPGMNVLVIDKGDLNDELARRRSAGELK